jgi:hypothetical protein
MYIFTTYEWAKLFHENPTLPMGEAKKIKFSGKIRVCTRHFFLSFYSQHYKYRFTMKLVHTYVVCRDIHVKFLFVIFSHFEMCFLNKESICTLDQICISLSFFSSFVTCKQNKRRTTHTSNTSGQSKIERSIVDNHQQVKLITNDAPAKISSQGPI